MQPQHSKLADRVLASVTHNVPFQFTFDRLPMRFYGCWVKLRLHNDGPMFGTPDIDPWQLFGDIRLDFTTWPVQVQHRWHQGGLWCDVGTVRTATLVVDEKDPYNKQLAYVRLE